LKLSRFAGIILVNAEGEVLLQLRCENERLYPNCWTLPGGKVEEGEDPEQAIVREVKEELGLDLRGHHLFKIIVENAPDEVIERHIYWGNTSEKTENMILGEGAALKYFPPRTIPRLRIAFANKPVIMDFLKTHRP
jgi:8-oxo-dGTP diphosphatase